MFTRMKFGAAVALIIVLCSVHFSHGTSLRIAYAEFVPFHFLDASGKLHGFFYDIITEALEKRMGVQLVWTAYPWPRCQENVKFGIDDALITVPTAERALYTTTHETPFFSKSLHLFTFKGHPQLERLRLLRSLADLKTGDFSVITYTSNGWHKQNVSSLGIRTYETGMLDNVWLMLAHMRGDVVIEWPTAVTPVLKRLGLEELVEDTGNEIATMPFHLLIRKDSAQVELLEEFERTIGQMRNDKTLSTIFSRYF